MEFFNNIKKLGLLKEKTSADENIYEGLGIVAPFTALENEQMSEFISELSNNEHLREDEKAR